MIMDISIIWDSQSAKCLQNMLGFTKLKLHCYVPDAFNMVTLSLLTFEFYDLDIPTCQSPTKFSHQVHNVKSDYAFRHSNISTVPQISNQIFTSKFILLNLNYASTHSNMPTWHQICTQKSKTITHTSVGFRNFKVHIWITSTTGRMCRWHTLLKLPLPVVFSLRLFKWQTGSSNFTSLHIMVIAHQCF
jgi:hypothetical protein